jgi:hypothetical protein
LKVASWEAVDTADLKSERPATSLKRGVNEKDPVETTPAIGVALHPTFHVLAF